MLVNIPIKGKQSGDANRQGVYVVPARKLDITDVGLRDEVYEIEMVTSKLAFALSC